MRKYIGILTFFISLTAMINAAQADKIYDYQQLAATLNDHPSLMALDYEAQALQENAEAELGLPNPMIEMGINNYPVDGGGFTRYAMTNKTLGLTQKIPSWEGRQNSREIVLRRADKTGLMKTLTRQRLEADLVTALVTLDRIESQRALLSREKNLLHDEVSYWQGRLGAGDNTLDEQARVDADLAQIDAKLALLKAQEEEAKANLLALTGLETWPESLPDVPDVPPQESADTETLPIALTEMDVPIANAQIQKAESAFNPDYQVSVKYSQRDSSSMYDDGDWVSAMVGVSVPLWYNDNQAPRLRAARLQQAKTKADIQDTVRQWQSRLATMKAKIAESEASIKALQAKKKAIESRVNTLQTAYESDGRLDIMIAAQRSALDIAFQLAGKKAEKKILTANFNSFLTTSNEFKKGENQ